MSLADPTIFFTENGDGSAKFTIAVDGDNHRFTVSQSGETGFLSYEETLSWRGTIRVSEPREEVYRLLIQSEEMTNYLETHDLQQIRRDR